jgi:histidine triad (HIT) family protein
MDCLFCKIIKGEIPAEIIWQDNEIFAFKDIHPLAPIHILIIPKKHISSIAELQDSDEKLMGKMIMAAKMLAEKQGIAKNGYKLLFRVGFHGGQEVPHIHLHLLGGACLFEDIHPIND